MHSYAVNSDGKGRGITVSGKSNPIIVGITGYAGNGKSEVAKQLKSYLSRAHCVHVDSYFLDYVVKFQKEVEGVFGQLITSNDVLGYLEQVERKATAKTVKAFLESFLPYAGIRIAESINSICAVHKPYFIIVEFHALPALNIWQEADYKLLVQTEKQMKRLELLNVREIFRANEQMVENRDFAVKEHIENAVSCIDCIIHNSYDENLLADVKNVAIRIKEMFGIA